MFGFNPARKRRRQYCARRWRLVLIAKISTWTRLLAGVVLIVTAHAGVARADWMNLTGAETAPNIAEITVLDDRVHVALEIYIQDLAVFEALLPDAFLKKPAADRAPLDERLAKFSSEGLQVIADDGSKLVAKLKRIEPRLRKDRFSPFAGMINPMTRRRVRAAPKDKRVVFAELEYPFAGQPRSLTFAPPKDAKGSAAVSIGFIAYHKAVPIIDFRYLSGPAKLTLDWADPWYSKFNNPNLKRHHSSPVMSFLYVEAREVRLEALIRVRDLQGWTDLGLDDDGTITPAEQEQVKERVTRFFAKRNPMKIDGAPVKPVAARAAFLSISLTGVQVVEEAKDLDLSTAIVGVILSYRVRQLPQHVSVQWELFNERIQRIPATSIDPAGPLLGFADVNDPTIEWRNYLRKYKEPKVTPVIIDDGYTIGVPVVSVGLIVLALIAGGLAVGGGGRARWLWTGAAVAGIVAAVALHRSAVVDMANPLAGRPSDETAEVIARQVLDNVNDALQEREPAALQTALDIVVSEAARKEVETELARALKIKVAGGGVARVDTIADLALKDITALDGQSGFRSLATWTARARAGHWGHVHRRQIGFRALMELVRADGAWKLAGLTVVEAKQKR